MHFGRRTQLLALLILALVACEADEDAPDATSDAGDADLGFDQSLDSADAGDTDDAAPTDTPDVPSSDVGPLEAQCAETIGDARVIEVAENLFVAVGYDLANTILLRTDAGNVVIDVSMSPSRAAVVREALEAVAPGPVAAIIYTHSHIDHVGGATVWLEDDTEVWATESLLPGVLRQYGAFRPAETERGRRQFGQHVGDEHLPCSAIGARADVEAATDVGFVTPTHTFTGQQTLTVGGATIELIATPGETDDHLAVWLPAQRALLPGDNYYSAFPNLYSIRGTRPRDVATWVDSLDTLRSFAPDILVPSHTLPVVGSDAVQRALRDYRDAIAWLRGEVVRGANRLEPVDAMVDRIALPSHLAEAPWLQERYGQVDWSVRAIYAQDLGWFDGRAEVLYPPASLAQREIALMGGAASVESAARAALEAGDPRWAAHLLGRLRDAGLRDEADIAVPLAAALRAVASATDNTNGRGYLLERALELEDAAPPIPVPVVSDELLAALPPDLIFDIVATRVRPDATAEVEASMTIVLEDVGESWTLTVRRGVAEVRLGEPLPGTPAPVATLTTTARGWVALALDVLDPVAAITSGELRIDDLPAALRFLGYFEQGI